jgi:hypothetical protein
MATVSAFMSRLLALNRRSGRRAAEDRFRT